MAATRFIGDALIEAGLLTAKQRDEALGLQRRWGSRFGEIVQAKGWVRAFDFYRVLAAQLAVPFVNLMSETPDAALFDANHIEHYARYLLLPWRRAGETIVLACADPGSAARDWARATYGERVDWVVTSKFDIQWQLQAMGGERLTDRALHALSERAPVHSARRTFTGAQLLAFHLMATAFIVGLAVAPIPTLMLVNALLLVFLLAILGLKILLAWHGSSSSIDIKVSNDDVRLLHEPSLPVYTVLVPMYKEPDVLPILANALRNFDYPLSKLDIKLVLEQDDHATIDAAKALGLESIFEIVRVPASEPRTKPKACNYALGFARGELLTIYDAEDKPEPDQLKKVVVAFRRAGAKVACIQGRLNYYNAEENWLTRMFTLEYTLWFDYFLPALEHLRIPIPLGGTSNHFRIEVLRGLDAWDPYNVTEDADLGVRLTQEGYRVGVVNSTTFEEANVSIPNWIRQRSRWIKGYMQTWLVHMRHPISLYRSLGHKGFWGFQLFVGGNFISALTAPLLWAVYLIWLVSDTRDFDPIFPPALLYIALITLLLGNGFFIYLTLLATFKRRLYRLAPYAFTVPLYWVMQSIAACKGFWQLLFKPFYWEKTTHGLSKHVAVERQAALS